MLTDRQFDRWLADRERQATQHPDDQKLAESGWTRGDHYRRKNNGVALRTYRAIKGGK